MKREIENTKVRPGRCCPGHDTYPNEKYSSRRSQRARSRDKKIEHQHARSIAKQAMVKEVKEARIVVAHERTS